MHISPRQCLSSPLRMLFSFLFFFFFSSFFVFVLYPIHHALFKDASIIPDFGKEEIPIIAMTHVTAGSERKGMKEKEEWRKLDICTGVLTMHMRGSGGDTYKGILERSCVFMEIMAFLPFPFPCYSFLLYFTSPLSVFVICLILYFAFVRLVREGFSDTFFFLSSLEKPEKQDFIIYKEGQTKEVMVNGRLFKIDVEEAHCKIIVKSFHPFCFFLLFTGGWSFLFMHGMGYGERVFEAGLAPFFFFFFFPSFSFLFMFGYIFILCFFPPR
ncbi:hypothetical protein LI328DRAFT_92940 [Trichoderma asperelloides]|nr:hypothetical protein LI328DRAFT_92940 [Trichoderma asperelloides]